MKIIIADDEELVRESLKDALSRIEGSFEISEASNGRELISAASAVDSALCFADIRMPGLSGLEAIESIGGRKPGICWVILSGYSDFEYARKAVRLGAIEYLLKPASDGEIEEVVRAAEKRLGKTGPQPVLLAENAVMHGLEPLEKGGRIEITADYQRRRGENGADIVIRDNGTGFDTARLEDGVNIGLMNVRQRMQIAFPDGSFRIESSPGEGTRIEIAI